VSRDPRSGPLLAEVRQVVPADEHEAAHVELTIDALERLARPFDEHAQADHVTASAFVVSPLGVVLHRHRLLGIWIQPGGHVDPGENPRDGALRETFEETGLRTTHLEPPVLVHVHVHPGPRGHRHFDCRWLLEATDTTLSPGASESHELGWFLPEAALARCEPELRPGLEKAFAASRSAGLAAVASWPT
jgi:8-oxo-dGTP pyrophosphatase MutT (NUDIX family)